MDVFPKFIIEYDSILGDCLILAKVTYHRQIAVNINNVKGGGWFIMDRVNKNITLHGESEQFGKASIDDIMNCINANNVFTSPALIYPITDKWNFFYKTETETIVLKTISN